MNHIIKTLFITLLLGTSLIDGAGIKPGIIKANEAAKPEPPHNVNYIALAAKGGLCGSIQIERKKEKKNEKNIYIESWHAKARPEQSYAKIMDSDTLLSDKSLKFRYDWAGNDPWDHYLIYVYKLNGRNREYVNADDYVEIKSLKHNVGCVKGPAGPKAEYGSLKMKKG